MDDKNTWIKATTMHEYIDERLDEIAVLTRDLAEEKRILLVVRHWVDKIASEGGYDGSGQGS